MYMSGMGPQWLAVVGSGQHRPVLEMNRPLPEADRPVLATSNYCMKIVLLLKNVVNNLSTVPTYNCKS